VNVSVKKPESDANKLNNQLIFNEKKYRHRKYSLIIGIDEAGRGPLAGPVVASAVSIKTNHFHAKIDDSKKISEEQRLQAYNEIIKKSYFGIGIISESVIDQINILEATFLAMSAAIKDLIAKLPLRLSRQRTFERRVCLLIDGNRFKSDVPYQSHTITQGDSHLFSIACASIVAKVTRDKILREYDKLFPQYGFRRHKGYPTPQHKSALRKYGPTKFHRKTFSY